MERSYDDIPAGTMLLTSDEGAFGVHFWSKPQKIYEQSFFLQENEVVLPLEDVFFASYHSDIMALSRHGVFYTKAHHLFERTKPLK